ncbi:MAG: tetratricopeptide repeat-containing sensor histidine kinase [Cellulophaga sp.]
MLPSLVHFMTFKKLQKKHLLNFVLFFGCLQICFGQQTTIDSLRRKIRETEKSNNFNLLDTTYINLLNNLGRELRYYKADSLLLLSTQALDFSKNGNYILGKIEAYNGIGNYYSDKGDNSKAIGLYKKAATLSRKSNKPDLTIVALNNISGAYGYMGDYAKALKGYLRGIELAETINDVNMLSIMNQNIGDLYASQKDYEQAMGFYKIVKSLNDKIGDDFSSAETMSNAASIYADMGKLDYAMFNINRSIAIFEKHKILDWLAFSFQVKGKIYVEQKKFKWALHWYNQADLLHKKLEDDREKIDLYNGMAKAHLGLKNDSISQKYALEAFNISTRIKSKEGKKNCAELLYILNKNKEDFATALEYHELFQKISLTLSRDENQNGLMMLKTKMEHDKQEEALILQNEEALATQKKYVYYTLGILLILIVITILVRRGEKIQKKLNKKLEQKKDILEKREKELKELNSTKDKLFSIIGHDLRGPIGALQGLIKLFKSGDIGKSEFLEFIPKLQDDVSHILFTLNNLLSWGQTQMNGAKTKPTSVALENVVAENMNLLSEIAQEKSIKLVNRLYKNTFSWSDVNQVDIVVRNLISNALKFTPEKGIIIVSAKEKNNFWEISVRDSGVGMSKEIVDKLFSNDTNTTTYGTNNEKGTGLGLSLCKEMVENNNGVIWAESTLSKGSCFYFTLPKEEAKYKKAG